MNCWAIVLKRVEERVLAVSLLEKELGEKINIFDAIECSIDGFSDFTHIRRDQKFTAGMIGCLLSHIELLKSDFDTICIFEDDCEFIGKKHELLTFLDSAPPYDILCLGTSEHVDYTPYNSSFVKVTRFWGAHAFIITKKAALVVLETYEQYMAKKKFLPADWLYSYAISENNLVAYAPFEGKKFFRQKIGMVSSATGNIRK